LPESGESRVRASAGAAAPRIDASPDLAPGDTTSFEVVTDPLTAGKHRLWVTARLTGDERPDDDRDSLLFRVGPGPLAVTEIQFHPAGGEGEWVELSNRSGRDLDVGAFTLSDRGTQRGTPRNPALLPADSLGVLAQDRA